MKIKETIERECCTRDKDFIKVKKNSFESHPRHDRRVCRHCGVLWVKIWQSDASDPDGGGYVWEKEKDD